MTGAPDPVIESQFVPLAFAYAAAKGADLDALRAALDLGAGDAIPAPGETMPLALSRIARVADRIAEAVGDPHLGLTLAELVPRGVGGAGELAARSAPTVGAALERCARYARIITPHQELSFTRTEDEIQLAYRVPGGSPPFAGRHTNEYALAAFLRLVREVAGDRPKVRRIWLAHQDPAQLPRLEAYFDTKTVELAKDTVGIAFDAELADRPVPAADPALLRVLEEYARKLMPAEEPGDPGVLGAVRRAVAGLLVDGVPSLGDTAKKMAVGERTLQRQLKAEGTSFAELVEEIRRSLARQHLEGTSMSVGEIACVLGYSDGRAFARAFARWFGESPSEFRARGRAPGAGRDAAP